MFARLSQIADISSLSKEERLKYDEGIRKYRDTLCVMDGAYKRPLACQKKSSKGYSNDILQIEAAV